METVRTRLIANGGAQNTIYARRMLADHTSRGVTSPNNDTLYASAWLDLPQGPVTVDAARFRQALFLAAADGHVHQQLCGARHAHERAARPTRSTLIGPNDASATRATQCRARADPEESGRWRARWWTDRTISRPRTRRRRRDDHRTQGRLDAADQAYAKGRAADAPWHDYFSRGEPVARPSIARRRPTSRCCKRIAPLGIGPDAHFCAGQVHAERAGGDRSRRRRGARARDRSARRGNEVDGWYYPGATLGNFGQDYIARADRRAHRSCRAAARGGDVHAPDRRRRQRALRRPQGVAHPLRRRASCRRSMRSGR